MIVSMDDVRKGVKICGGKVPDDGPSKQQNQSREQPKKKVSAIESVIKASLAKMLF